MTFDLFITIGRAIVALAWLGVILYFLDTLRYRRNIIKRHSSRNYAQERRETEQAIREIFGDK